MSENQYNAEADPGDEARDFTGPDGVESADRILELERDRERDGAARSDDSADFPRELGEEDSAAADQGNRDGDEMLSEGDDAEANRALDEDDDSFEAFEDEPFTENDPLARDREV
ncbi:hypothetical protein [Brachybacterium tyrofermentans]|uniref:hypothetical protein n=1 Tax=Brachybacterium tyrofermentans TaxID=47848 RepID=UPI003F9051C2